MKNYARAFKDAGGDVVFRMYAFDDANGHLLFRRKQALWEADVDTFIRQVGLINALPLVPTPPQP